MTEIESVSVHARKGICPEVRTCDYPCDYCFSLQDNSYVNVAKHLKNIMY